MARTRTRRGGRHQLGLDWVAWSAIDECNRALNDEPTGVNKDHPIELTTQENVPPADVNAYHPSLDFKTESEQLWGVQQP